MDNAENELRRRRERGRSSQAAFRKRQAKAIEDTKDQNRRLKEALGSIVKAACAEDRRELISVIREVAEAAGLDTKHLTPSESSSISSLASSVSSSIETSTSAYKSTAESRTLQNSSIVRTASGGPEIEINSVPKYVLRDTANNRPWLNPFHYLQITQPPKDIVPYLGDARYTLAGQVFWAAIEQGQAASRNMHREMTWDDLESPVLRKIVTHSKHLMDMSPIYLKAMIEARLEYRDYGVISAEYSAAAEDDSILVLHTMVKEDYRSRGHDLNLWLTPCGVETRVRATLGNELFRMFMMASRSPESSMAHRSLKEVVAKLVNSYLCFGDGPRWNVGIIDQVICDWMSTMNDESW